MRAKKLAVLKQWHWSYPGSLMITCVYLGSLVKQNRGCVCVCADYTHTQTHTHTHTHTHIGREGDREVVGEGRERQKERFILRNWLMWLWSLCLCIDPMDCSQAPLSFGFFPGNNTGVGCHFLPQGIFPTQRSNPSPALQVNSLPLSHWRSPVVESGESQICRAGQRLETPAE